jgi:hypothetical protein
MNYLTRVVHPDTVRCVSQSFDQKWYDFLADQINLTTTEKEEARKFLTLPFRHGGCGFRAVSDFLPLAHWGALAQAAPYLRKHDLLPPDGAFTASCESTLQSVRGLLEESDSERVGEALPPVDCPAGSWPIFYANEGKDFRIKLQHGLTNLYFKPLAAALTDSLPPSQRATRLSQCQKGSAAWLMATPNDMSEELKMDDAYARLAMRYRCGVSPLPPDDLPETCICGKSLPEDPWHLLACPRMAGKNTRIRHDMVSKCLVKWCNRVGGKAKWDRKLPVHRGTRPDGVLDFTTTVASFDGAITHPSCKG